MKYAKSIVATIMGLVTPLAALAAANGGVRPPRKTSPRPSAPNSSPTRSHFTRRPP